MGFVFEAFFAFGSNGWFSSSFGSSYFPGIYGDWILGDEILFCVQTVSLCSFSRNRLKSKGIWFLGSLSLGYLTFLSSTSISLIKDLFLGHIGGPLLPLSHRRSPKPAQLQIDVADHHTAAPPPRNPQAVRRLSSRQLSTYPLKARLLFSSLQIWNFNFSFIYTQPRLISLFSSSLT